VERHLFEPVRPAELERADAPAHISTDHAAHVSADPPAMSLLLLASPDAVRETRRVVRGFAEALMLAPAIVDAAELAVAEAASNIVRHAYADDELGTLELHADFQDGTLEVVISDRGRGVRLPGHRNVGVGLPLIAELTDEFTIGEGCPRGVEVWMRFVVGR
jgi:anti-sigma regulatory factor (Ser/Thr protein kinase)